MKAAELDEQARWALERLGDDAGPGRLALERQTLATMRSMKVGEPYPPQMDEIQERLVKLLEAKNRRKR